MILFAYVGHKEISITIRQFQFVVVKSLLQYV